MTAPSGGGSNIEIKSLGPIEANTDTKIDITGVTIPSSVSAGWGPFGILTRAVSGGQILDINNSFATIYASEVLAAAGALTIIPKEDMQSAVTVNRPATLYFNFRLDVNLWEYDTIVITVPALWTPPVSLETCISIDVAS